jgi:hypothetical protein
MWKGAENKKTCSLACVEYDAKVREGRQRHMQGRSNILALYKIKKQE